MQILEVVILDRKASTSYLQRRLRIGYNRAAELIEEMEKRGIVGPPSGSGNKRDIMIFDDIEEPSFDNNEVILENNWTPFETIVLGSGNNKLDLNNFKKER